MNGRTAGSQLISVSENLRTTLFAPLELHVLVEPPPLVNERIEQLDDFFNPEPIFPLVDLETSSLPAPLPVLCNYNFRKRNKKLK